MPAQTSIRNLNEKFEGAYSDGNYSGLITGVTGGSGANGHLWACRWAPTTSPAALAVEKRRFAIITRLRVRGFTISGYTAAQEVLLALIKLTGYTVAHSGGVALAPQKKRTNHPASLMTIQMANAAQLTAGTHTLGTDPIRNGAFSELAAAATVPKGVVEIFLSTEDLAQYPIVLAPNEGLLVRNEIAMGAGGTMRLNVEADWLETERY